MTLWPRLRRTERSLVQPWSDVSLGGIPLVIPRQARKQTCASFGALPNTTNHSGNNHSIYIYGDNHGTTTYAWRAYGLDWTGLGWAGLGYCIHLLVLEVNRVVIGWVNEGRRVCKMGRGVPSCSGNVDNFIFKWCNLAHFKGLIYVF